MRQASERRLVPRGVSFSLPGNFWGENTDTDYKMKIAASGKLCFINKTKLQKIPNSIAHTLDAVIVARARVVPTCASMDNASVCACARRAPPRAQASLGKDSMLVQVIS